MAIRSQRVVSAFLAGDARRPVAHRKQTICITLAPKAGVAPSPKAPVRIYLGTEPVQFRAERAFVWSIERVRDPARRYEIHLMRDFAGFKRRLWLTGFTNYRFAIPELAGYQGRAIYNDADQIYLEDPAHLFDTPMDGAGVLSINDRDTSVMLIDCAKMAPLWNGQTARGTRNRELEARMRAAGLWGALDAGWNARDEEYDRQRSRLVHYTTIHTQPWRPTPADYVYRANPASEIWLDLESEADAAGFQLFNAAAPSPEFAPACAAEPGGVPRADRLADFRRLLADARAKSVFYCGYDAPEHIRALAAADTDTHGRPRTIETARPETLSAGPSETADVVFADGLERLPDLDLPWVLDALFARARYGLAVAVRSDGPSDPLWWHAQLAAAGARYPHRHWRLVVRRRGRLRGSRPYRCTGGALLRVPPKTWVLLHYKTGHASQALGVADALGWPFETRAIRRAPARHVLGLLRSRLPWRPAALNGDIRAPWPDLVIASGWLPALIARWIADRNLDNTRLILLGRRGGWLGESEHIGIVCRHFRLPPHPRQLETILPPSKAVGRRLTAAGQRWPDLYGQGTNEDKRPRVALLVGGNNVQHALDTATATHMVDSLRAAIEDAGARLAVLTSRRTSGQASQALRDALPSTARFEPWRPRSEVDNPYLGYLATADVVVVTGESESMLAEAVATGKPVYIYPLPARAPGARRRVADWVVRQAETDRFNARGSRRPQQGLQYLCARAVERRIFVPRRDMPALHKALVAHGVARIYNGTLERWSPPAWHETGWIARRIRAWLPAAGPRAQTPGPTDEQSGAPRSVHA